MDANEELMCLSLLAQDPAEAFANADAATHANYLRELDSLSVACGASPSTIALAALDLSRETPGLDGGRTHVGYFLIGAGRGALEQQLDVRLTRAERAKRWLRDHARPVFLFGVVTKASLLSLAILVALARRGTPDVALASTVLVGVPVALRMAADLLRAVLGQLYPPRRLPRFHFSSGIPDAFRTAVIIPVIVSRQQDVEHAIDTLEKNFRSCPIDNLQFCLLTDFADSITERSVADELPDRALNIAIAGLNTKYAAPGKPRFFRLHRPRVFSREQGIWWGWERKRGKVLEFCRFVSAQPTHLSVFPLQWRPVTFAITIDVGSCASPDALREMVAIMAFPTQWPRLDDRQVVCGYGVVRPTLIATPSAANGRFFSWMFSSHVGVKPERVLRPSVYQDVFGDDLFGGQGGFHIEAFHRCVEGRLPQNAILSHDHLEGMLCRVAYASDVTFVDDFPTSLMSWRSRQHRWVRGDVQTMPWLLPKVCNESGARERNPLRVFERWKITYTLLGHVYPICLLLIACASWCGVYRDGGVIAWLALATIQFTAVLNSIMKLFTPTLPSKPGERGMWSSLRGWRTRLSVVSAALRQALHSWIVSLVMLLDNSALVSDAIVRTLYRVIISRQRLLEWKSAATVQFEIARSTPYEQLREMRAAPFLAVLLGALVAVTAPHNLLSAAPALVVWFVSPLLAYRLLVSPRGAQTQPATRQSGQ